MNVKERTPSEKSPANLKVTSLGAADVLSTSARNHTVDDALISAVTAISRLSPERE
jgi:hypothetical protein